MILSMSYSRYFRTATAMAVHSHKNARLCSTFTAAEFTQIDVTNRTTRTRAAVAHHFSCNRSSPDDLANLTTSATTLSSNAAVRTKPVVQNSHAPGPYLPRREEQEQEREHENRDHPYPVG